MHEKLIAERDEIIAQANRIREEYQELDASDPTSKSQRKQLEAVYAGLDRRYRKLNADIKAAIKAQQSAVAPAEEIETAQEEPSFKPETEEDTDTYGGEAEPEDEEAHEQSLDIGDEIDRDEEIETAQEEPLVESQSEEDSDALDVEPEDETELEEEPEQELDTDAESEHAEEPAGEDEHPDQDDAGNGPTTEERLDLPEHTSPFEDGEDEPKIEMFSDSPFAVTKEPEVSFLPMPSKPRRPSRLGLWSSLKDLPETLVDGLSSFSGSKSASPAPPPKPLSPELEALHAALRDNDEEALAERIESGTDIEGRNDEGLTPLLVAACNGHAHLAERLLDSGANIESQGGDDHNTALHIAVIRCDLEMVALLLARGANVCSVNNLGQMPLHLAAQMGHTQLLSLLIEHDANINALTAYNCTPLYLAARQGHADVARILLENKVFLNIEDLDGYTALHVAAASGHLEVVRLLVEHGSLSGQSNFKENPIKLARRNNHPEVVEFLRSAGA